MSSEIKSAALKACRHFMLHIARFLLRNGIGYREFSEISKLAFIQVASDEYGLRGRKTNMSRVSVMTGLNRKEVRKVRERLENEDWDLDPDLSKPVSLLGVWYTDPRYLGPRGAPKWLPFEAPDGTESFCSLVRETGGDLPPGAMLKELVRAGCVKEAKPGIWQAVKRQFSPGGIDLFQVQRFGECLHDLANTIAKNMEKVESNERLFEFRAWAQNVDIRATPKLKKVVAEQGNAYLEAIDDWLEAHSPKEPIPTSIEGIRCGVGIYYFESVPAELTANDGQ